VSLVAAGALAAVAAVLLVSRGGDESKADRSARDTTPTAHLEVLSPHPLATRATERLLTERYLAVPDDDETDVRCAAREPMPAHSVRRCRVLYPGGVNRTVVVITNANGAEVLSEP
jgi:hypothetical protein